LVIGGCSVTSSTDILLDVDCKHLKFKQWPVIITTKYIVVLKLL